jgi:F-type H+-transporting ATPase subunit a
MEHNFTWVSLIPFLKDLPGQVSNGLIVSVVLLVIVILGYKQLKKTDEEVVPAPGMTFRNFAELLVEAVSGIIMDTMGPRGKEFVLLVGTLGIFILFNNLSGFIPGFTPATDNVNTTFACSLTVFVMTHYYGVKEHGIKYLKQFLGPVLWLSPLMFFIEIVGHIARPISLGLRLFGNIFGDHLVTGIFFLMLPLLLPVPFLVLGLFVAFVQTFVFMMLAMAYFSGAISHEEH